jgi:type IV secretory pathway TrbF-like protein
MTKSGEVRKDVLKMLKYSIELDAMEHFLDEQFRNIKADQIMIRRYILKASAYLEKVSDDLVKELNEKEINKEN